MTAELVPARMVSWHVFDPHNALFKEHRKDHAQNYGITCTLKDCALRDAGHCTWGAILGWDACPYGRYQSNKGPTPKAHSCRTWIAAQKKLHEGVPHLSIQPTKMAFVGEYVYLPYAHMKMCTAAPFREHGHAFKNGCAFVPATSWNIATVLTLIDFRPQALMGGEITSYQLESVPLFIQHLREVDPAMFAQLIRARPVYDQEPNYVGRKALLRTLKPNIEWDANVHKDYPVRWRWDGTFLFTTSKHAYSSTWGGSIPMKITELKGVPEDNAAIKVQDNAWVTPDTIFLD